MANLTRKEFLSSAGKELFSSKSEPEPYPYRDPSNKELPRSLQKTSTGIGQYQGTWGDTQILHLLRRTMFGVSKSDFEYFRGKTLSQCISELLTLPTSPPSPPLNNYTNGITLVDPEVPLGQTWINATASPTLEGPRRQSFKAWWTGLMLNQERNIREKMTLFWHNHFATESITVQDSRFVYKHHALLRSMCLGNFREFVKQISIDPAMLTYLNGEKSSKTAPDENYARELQELFTVGKYLPQHYTEEDVKQAAKVLTGWRNNRTGINSFFDSTKHDTTNKTFSSFYNNTVITGRTGANAGLQELDDLLTMIFNQEEVAKFICRKLYHYFVYYVIDESVETNVIIPLANVFRNSGYDIKTVVETLLKSEHFFDPLNIGCMIKQPVDHVVGLARQMNLTYPDASDVQRQYAHWIVTQQYSLILTQDIGDPPNVAGWPAFYEDPQFNELWINSDTLPKRNSLCDILIYSGYTRNNFKLMFDCVAFASQFSNPSLPDSLINDILQLLYPMEISSSTKTFIKTSFLLSGQSGDYVWTDAWNAWAADPTNTTKRNAINTRLQALLKYTMGQAEYQLC